MARMDEEEEMEELEEEPSPSKKASGKKAKGGFPLKPLLLAIVVGGAVVGGGFFAWSKFSGSSSKGHEKGLEAAGASGEEAEMGIIEPLETFIVNLADNGGKRYLKVGINLELSSPELGEEVKKKTPFIRDTILILLSSKSYTDIGDTKGKTLLREEIVARINPVLKEGRIKKVYFSEFVVQ
ncbi:MAG: flagellar basal body-associated FliL family protein [Candidatus Tectomicrobia bacterium]|uniref:Flagellar protein FliL n=1 Tax=Tectimicrobiota bacterium TaxID=2528274 RepID=A0A932FWC5_UNCTE|nr:flagellar basal body-associated FliL family protein [Candidatus Tectomicrobia bacterium]